MSFWQASKGLRWGLATLAVGTGLWLVLPAGLLPKEVHDQISGNVPLLVVFGLIFSVLGYFKLRADRLKTEHAEKQLDAAWYVFFTGVQVFLFTAGTAAVTLLLGLFIAGLLNITGERSLLNAIGGPFVVFVIAGGFVLSAMMVVAVTYYRTQTRKDHRPILLRPTDEQQATFKNIERLFVDPLREVGTWRNFAIVGIWTAFWAVAACVKVVFLVQMIEDGEADSYRVAILLALASFETAMFVWFIRKLTSVWSALKLVRSSNELKQVVGNPLQ
jgi:hypothetical protein